jgi:hypothetical protein
MSELARLTGYPVVVNTSLNRGGEPIVETTAQALAMFLDRPGIDVLIADSWLVERLQPWQGVREDDLCLSDDVVLTMSFVAGEAVLALSHRGHVQRLTSSFHGWLSRMGNGPVPMAELLPALSPDENRQAYELLMRGAIRHARI